MYYENYVAYTFYSGRVDFCNQFIYKRVKEIIKINISLSQHFEEYITLDYIKIDILTFVQQMTSPLIILVENFFNYHKTNPFRLF